MTLDELYRYARARGMEVDDVRMRALTAVSFPQGWIAMDRAKIETGAEEKALLAHEVGHVETGAFYRAETPFETRARCERKADRRAAELLIPREALRRAVRQGVTEVWELAEYFGVPEPFVRRAIELYRCA